MRSLEYWREVCLRRNIDSSTSQQDALFQPRAQRGMSFPRFSHLVIERKLALLRRTLSMEDSYTRWAAESILRRGCPGPWTSATLAATSKEILSNYFG